VASPRPAVVTAALPAGGTGGAEGVRNPSGAPGPSADDAAPATGAAAAGGGASATPDGPAIVDAPMAWSAERERLTLAYRRAHSDPDAADLTIEPTVIVLHYTDGGSAKSTRAYFDTPTIEASRAELARAGKVNVSAHFVVDRDGTIYQLQPVTRFARHCIGLNHVAIGIENAGNESTFPLTAAQVDADAALIRELARTHKITRLLGHYEVMGFRTNPLYLERDPTYKNDKPDPGKAFMAKVRAKVSDLGLAGP